MPRPNILIVTTHDSGRHFACYGVPTVQTPAIDALAADGVLFERMFAASPICSPSRGALLTGRYPLANGLVGLAGGVWNWEFNDYQQHLSHIARNAGYDTRMFGLQHETSHIERMGFCDTTKHGIKDGGKTKTAVDVAADVAEFLRARGDEEAPFYAQVGFHETHTRYDIGGCKPEDAKGAWIPPYAKSHVWPEWAAILQRFGSDPAYARSHLAEFQGSLQTIDRAVGGIVAALRATGLEDNTILLFNTDHGPELPGAKWTMYDPGLGIAFILRWPRGGACGGRRCDWLLGNVDFLPTLLELTGLDGPDNLQGVSFADACRRDVSGSSSPRETAYGSWVDGLNFAVRTERHKLIRNLVPVDSTGRACPDYELYDLELDPLELTDVAPEPAYADVLADLRARMDAWLEEMGDPVVDGPIAGETHQEKLAEYRRRYETRHGVVRPTV
jgi:arylsulfatase A-like enzyme